MRHLSAEARTALVNFGTSRRGARAPQGTSKDIMRELFAARLISRTGNLTDRGGVARDCAVCDALDTL